MCQFFGTKSQRLRFYVGWRKNVLKITPTAYVAAPGNFCYLITKLNDICYRYVGGKFKEIMCTDEGRLSVWRLAVCTRARPWWVCKLALVLASVGDGSASSSSTTHNCDDEMTDSGERRSTCDIQAGALRCPRRTPLTELYRHQIPHTHTHTHTHTHVRLLTVDKRYLHKW